jgi:hypothetical protein
MEKIFKGDTVIDKVNGEKYLVESIEVYDNITVIFTDGVKTKCVPINQVYKLKSLSYYFLKLFKGEKLTNDEDNEVTSKLKVLKPVTILPLDPNFLKSR